VLRKSFAVILLIVCFWSGGALEASAAPQQPATETPHQNLPSKAAQSFLQEAESLYQAANGDDIEAVSRYTARTEARLRALPMEGVASAEGIEALARSVSRMKRLTAAVSPDPDKIRLQSAEIRMAADAIAHPQAPMWHRYGAIMREDLRVLEQAVANKASREERMKSLGELQAHYRIIRTAVLMQAETSVTEKVDSVLRYAERMLGAEAPNPAYAAGVVPSIRDALGELFPAAQDSSSAAAIAPVTGPPWGWSAFVGVFIVAVLSWVGWRRYQGLEPIHPPGSLPQERHGRR